MTITKHSSMLCGHRYAAAVVISGKRRRHHFQVANASDRPHCDNDPKALSRRMFLIACAQSCRESRLARNVTALQLHNYSIQCVKSRCQNAAAQLPVGLLTALPMWISYSLWISWISIFRHMDFVDIVDFDF